MLNKTGTELLADVGVLIDTLDEELVQLIARREELAHKVAQVKYGAANSPIPIVRTETEQRRLAKIRKLAVKYGCSDSDAVVGIFRQLMDRGVSIQTGLHEMWNKKKK
jgi:chorismate mutase